MAATTKGAYRSNSAMIRIGVVDGNWKIRLRLTFRGLGRRAVWRQSVSIGGDEFSVEDCCSKHSGRNCSDCHYSTSSNPSEFYLLQIEDECVTLYKAEIPAEPIPASQPAEIYNAHAQAWDRLIWGIERREATLIH